MTQENPHLNRIDVLLRGAVGQVFTGATALISQDDRVIFHRAYGALHADPDSPPVELATRFDLASLTKLFTATGLMWLVQRGDVDLDAPLYEVLPEFGVTRPIAPAQDPFTYELLPPLSGQLGEEVNARSVTFRRILTHTSGLAPWRALFQAGQQEAITPLPHLIPTETRAQRIAALYDCGLACPPGLRIAYSDLGFVLLGEAIKCISGLPLEHFIHQTILQPLKMSHTDFNPLAQDVSKNTMVPTGVCLWRRRRCWGEVHDANAAGLGGAAGHAGLFATADDLLAFARAFLHDYKLLSAELITEMTREQARWQGLRRGLGWQLPGEDGAPVGKRFNRTSFGHTGFTGVSLWIDPVLRLIVVLLTNRVYFGNDASRITQLRIQLHDAAAEAVS